MSAYDQAFYAGISESTASSAALVSALLAEHFSVRSAVDIGCGEGVWLAAFKERGAADILGLDGDYVNRDRLAIPKECFRAVDLAQPIQLDRTFDLAICLEVAEHLPAERGPTLVRDLTALSNLVLFSAAIPFQGGTEHINERWQDYWRDLFKAEGHEACDLVRPAFWGDPRLAWYYQQNMILYGKPDALEAAGLAPSSRPTLNLASKRLVENIPKIDDLYFGRLVKMLPRAFANALRNRLRG
jgi:hypothetical protein